MSLRDNFKTEKLSLYLGIGILFLGVSLLWLNEATILYGHKGLRMLLRKKLLVRSEPLPPGNGTFIGNPKGAIYVLSGSHKSLIRKFQFAAELYNRVGGTEIWILSLPGITHYDPIKGRNLTNDEWAFEKLIRLGIFKQDIQTMSLEEGFFGTFTEAKGISNLLKTRGYKTLILITSSYHSKRTWIVFSKFLQSSGIQIYVYPVHDPILLHWLLLEYVKLFIYENVLIPAYFCTIWR